MVADVERVEPTDLPPLAASIDPGIVDRFVESPGSDTDTTGSLCFTYAGWNVFVRADGMIVIGDPGTLDGPTQLI